MKKHYLLLMAFAGTSLSFGQQTITSAGNGNASNPFTWDCLCFPAPNDHIVINHNVGMDVDWLVNSGGSITINASGSLNQVGTHSIAFDGSNTMLQVSGNFTMENVSIANDAVAINNGTVNIPGGVFVGTSSSYQNFGTTYGIDSMVVDGNFQNSGNFSCGDILFSGTAFNSSDMTVDSLGVLGSFTITGGTVSCSVLGSTGTLSISTATFNTVENFYNAGDLVTNASALINCGASFYSGDTLGGSATFTHDGGLGVMQDLYFSDNVSGSGTICVNGYSANSAIIQGTLDFCDATGSTFDTNIGNISPTTTYCQPGCVASISEENVSWAMYPNPAKNAVKLLGQTEVKSVVVYSISGMKVADLQVVNGQFSVEAINSGTYFVVLNGVEGALPLRLTVD